MRGRAADATDQHTLLRSFTSSASSTSTPRPGSCSSAPRPALRPIPSVDRTSPRTMLDTPTDRREAMEVLDCESAIELTYPLPSEAQALRHETPPDDIERASPPHRLINGVRPQTRSRRVVLDRKKHTRPSRLSASPVAKTQSVAMRPGRMTSPSVTRAYAAEPAAG